MSSPSILASLAARLAGETVLSAWCSIPEPSVSAILAQEAFEAITLDMQHGPTTLGDVIRAVPLIHAAGKPVMARIPVGEFQNVSKLFDAGVSGVIAPMINTIEDAKALSAYAKYPPLGERSWGSYGGLGASGLDANAYFRQANGFSLTFAMVETRESMAILDDILALPGIDAVFVGPSDLSIALTDGRQVDATLPIVDEAIAHIVARASAVGKPVAVYAQSPERARDFFRLGAKVVTLMSDGNILRLGAQTAIKTIRG